jgi:hypothetical protein
VLFIFDDYKMRSLLSVKNAGVVSLICSFSLLHNSISAFNMSILPFSSACIGSPDLFNTQIAVCFSFSFCQAPASNSSASFYCITASIACRKNENPNSLLILLCHHR